MFPLRKVDMADKSRRIWDLDSGTLVLVVPHASQQCVGCQQRVSNIGGQDVSLEHLLLHVYRLLRVSCADRDITGFASYRVDGVLGMVKERFPTETAEIDAEIARLEPE
jgi:hypothetical protein